MGIAKLDVHAAAEIENTVFPMPSSIELGEGELSFDSIFSVMAAAPEALNAASYLCEKIKEKYGHDLFVSSEKGEIVMEFSPKDDDGYEIEIADSRCHIKAGNKRAFFYAADTLIQLCTENGIKNSKVYDEPMMDMRGIHFALPSRKDMPFLKKLIKEIVVPMRYNMVFIQLSGAMRYDNYPEINEMWLKACEMYEKGEWPLPAHYGFVGRDILEKNEIAEFCDYLRSFGLEIVPEIQSLSHSQYITAAYPFLAEIEKKTAGVDDLYADDAKPAEFYPHNICPSHPEYYDYVLGIADEVVDLIKPERFLHFGHDEVYIMGKCEKCSARGAANVFAEEVNRLNEYTKSKGLTMMIWGDMLQDKRYSVPEAIDMISKDIILLDFVWYFFLDKDIEDRLLDAGFKVMMGNMYSSHYTRYNSRSKKKGIIGAEVSMWVDCNEHSYAYEGKMYDLVFSANTVWNSDYDTGYRLAYNEIVKPLLWNMRCKIGEFAADGKEQKLMIGGSLKDIPLELIWNVPYENAVALSCDNNVAEINVDGCADLVMITHATDIGAERIMWKPAHKIGEYDLVYEDGTSTSTPVFYGDNIYKFTQTYGAPLVSPLFRHEGYTGTYTSRPICGKDNFGNDYTLLECPIVNPHPEKKISKIVAKHMENTDAKLLIFDAKLINN
jgi:hexosaminidase